MKIIIKFLKMEYKIKNKIAKDRFRLLITTILSQRSRDENTDRAASQLFSKAKSPSDILSLPPLRLQQLIKPAGMYRQKTIKIRRVCKAIVEKYKGRIPKTRSELLALYGVGYKTADIVLSYGYGVPTIAVDVHVAVCAQRLELTKSGDVETIRKDLEEIVPKKDRHAINHGFVEFGKQICRTRNPKCLVCPFNKFCPYGEIVSRHIKLKSINNIYL